VVRPDPNMRAWRGKDKELVVVVLTTQADGIDSVCRNPWFSLTTTIQVQMGHLSARVPPALPPTAPDVLNELPETLDATYDRTLEDIE